MRRGDRSWQAQRSGRTVGFLAPIAPIKPKGLSLGFHTLHPCLHSHDRRHQLPRVPHLRISATVEPASNRLHLQWIRGVASTSPSSAWKASSNTVFSVRGPWLRSGCYPARRICRHRPTAMWCRSPTSMSVSLLPPPTNFFGGCCTTTRSSCSFSIPTGSSTRWHSSLYARDS